jgi:uncharacterized membrane protein YbhN (UPF0104 family)
MSLYECIATVAEWAAYAVIFYALFKMFGGGFSKEKKR